MGLFSSKTVITVGTSISPLIAEKPNLIRSAILRATFNDWAKTPTIVDALINGYNIDPRGYYRYGESKYLYGLPEGHRPQVVVREDEIPVLLASFHNVAPSDIKIEYLKFNSYSRIITSNWYFKENATLDMSTGLFSNVSFLPEGHVGKLLHAEFDEINDLNEGNSSPELMHIELFSRFEHYHPDTPDDKSETKHTEYIQPIDMNMKDLGNSTYGVIYRVKNQDNNDYSAQVYFNYDPELDLYPELNVYDEDDLNSPYYPIMPIRVDKEWIDEESEVYKTGVKLLKYLDVDLHVIQDALKENPDVDDVDSSFIALGMPIGKNHDRDEIDCKYLYKYFLYLKEIQNVDKREFGRTLALDNPAYNMLDVRDPGFDTTIYWNYVDSGTIPYDESKAGDFELITYIAPVQLKDPNKDDDFYSNDYIQINFHDKKTQTGTFVQINGIYHVSTVYRGKVVVNTLYSAFNEDDDKATDGFFIPLCEEVMNTLSKKEYTHVAYSSLILINYAVVKTKIKWYQQKAFWRFIQIVIFIVSIIYMQPQLSALASQTVSEIAFMIVQSVVVNFAINEAVGYVLGMLAEVIGGEAAVIIGAVIAAIAAVYGLSGNLNLNLPFADKVLQLSNIVMTEVNKLQQLQARRLAEEITSFKEEYENLLSEIEDAQDLLGEEGMFDPFWVIEGSSIMAGESASDFLMRNTSLDVNAVALDAVTNFTENALRLPTLAGVNNNFRGF